jgi:hypothetical protein
MTRFTRLPFAPSGTDNEVSLPLVFSGTIETLRQTTVDNGFENGDTPYREVADVQETKFSEVRPLFVGCIGFPLGREVFRGDMARHSSFRALEVCRMKVIRALVASILLSLVCVATLSAQENKAEPSVSPSTNPVIVPPNLLVLVRQEIQYGKASARQKLEVAVTRLCNRLDVPNSWIDLQSVSGSRDVLFFDPFDSFEQLEQAGATWSQIYAAHPDLARMQEEIDALLKSEETTIAVRRDDLGYRADHIDLSEARYMRVVEVHLLPGHSGDFVEASRILVDAFDKIGADTPWVVYQVKFGMESPIFLVFMPMPALKQNDDLLAWGEDLLKAEGEHGARRLEQMAREGYVSTKNKLYAVNSEMSHVFKEAAARNPGFWTPKPVLAAKRSGAKGTRVPGSNRHENNPTELKVSEKTHPH